MRIKIMCECGKENTLPCADGVYRCLNCIDDYIGIEKSIQGEGAL